MSSEIKEASIVPLSSDYIQDKEKIPFGFFCFNCEIYENDGYSPTFHTKHTFHQIKDMRICRPNRCKDCDRELARWKRCQEGVKRWKKKFNYQRHKFIKFSTIGLPGSKQFPIDSCDKAIAAYRQELVYKFKLLRRKPIWKNNVDGGQWFFEVTTRTNTRQMSTNMKSSEIIDLNLNPHLHIVFMGPSKMDYDEIQKACKSVGLGKMKFSPMKRGTKINNIMKYVYSYLKKDGQFKGINRGTFGFLVKKNE